MERVCPYLALAADRRTAVAGYDADHRCMARTPPEPLARSRQVQLCLTEAHGGCDWLRAAESARRQAQAGPRPAPDTVIGTTRLVLEPERAWRQLAARPPAIPTGRRVLAGAAGVVGLALVATSAAGGIGRLLGPTPAPPGQPATTPPATLAPLGASAAPEPVGTPTPTPSASVAPAASATPTPPATPGLRTYVVKAGDTLSAIAAAYGTTIGAIRQANGIQGDVINIGQVLIIP